MIYRRIITIYESRRMFNGSEQIFNFAVNKNGCPDNIEIDILNAIKDMNKKGIIDLNKFHNLLDYETKISLNNISENLKIPIVNISNNLEIVLGESI